MKAAAQADASVHLRLLEQADVAASARVAAHARGALRGERDLAIGASAAWKLGEYTSNIGICRTIAEICTRECGRPEG